MAKHPFLTPNTIQFEKKHLLVPPMPVIPFIEGDGIGTDIWPAAKRVIDAAISRAYGKDRQLGWRQVFAGERAFKDLNNWLPDETLEAFKTYHIGIKGPLTTPIGEGVRSINVALRKSLDLYVCVRPVQYFDGVPLSHAPS